MPLEQKPLRPIQVDYKCDVCNIGYYRQFSSSILECINTEDLTFKHQCSNVDCKDIRHFKERYPTVRYAWEGELMDLDNYIPAQG